MTTIITALKQGKFANIQQLITEQTDLNQADDAGITPLHFAVQHGQRDVVEALLIAGANPNIKNDTADVEVINSQLAENFSQHTADLRNGKQTDIVDIQHDIMQTIITELQTLGSSSALHIAIKQQNKAIIKLLLEYGADPNIVDSGNCTPLHWAAVRGFVTGVQLLLEYNANPNQQDLAKSTALHEAIRKKHISVIKLLLDKQANPNLVDLTGNTPLQLASDDNAILEVLITNSKFVPAGFMQH